MAAASKAPSPAWRHPVWSTAKKDLVGTALGPARLCFTVGKGIVTEVFYPRIDIPQVRDMGLIIADGKGFWQAVLPAPPPPAIAPTPPNGAAVEIIRSPPNSSDP